MSERKIDSNWASLLEEFQLIDEIHENGYVDINSGHFSSLKFETRLMTKIDHRYQRPSIFQDLNINILTRGRNLWRLGRFEVFEDLPDDIPPSSRVKMMSVPSDLETVDARNLSSEANVLSAATASGVVSDFLGTEVRSTVSGRMSTGDFSFKVNGFEIDQMDIQVSKAQIEIDAGFEGPNDFTVVEAKMRLPGDFCTRQLYYPFRLWSGRLSQKPVRTVFLSYSNELLDLYEFEFTDVGNYSSSQLLRRKRYSLGSNLPASDEIAKMAADVPHMSPPKEGRNFIPFPQADSFERVLDLVSFVNQEPKTEAQIKDNYDFVERQADYYPNAARYLGLVEKSQSGAGEKLWHPSALAKRLLALPLEQRTLEIAKLLLQIEPIASTFRAWNSTGSPPSKDWVTQRLASSPLSITSSGQKLGPSTLKRRASTIIHWAGWLVGLCS